MKYNIQEISYGVLGSAKTFEVEVMNFVLGAESADVAVRFYDGENMLERKLVPIPSEVYEQWGTDDSFILNYVVEQLGLTLSEPEPEPIVEEEILP